MTGHQWETTGVPNETRYIRTVGEYVLEIVPLKGQFVGEFRHTASGKIVKVEQKCDTLFGMKRVMIRAFSRALGVVGMENDKKRAEEVANQGAWLKDAERPFESEEVRPARKPGGGDSVGFRMVVSGWNGGRGTAKDKRAVLAKFVGRMRREGATVLAEVLEETRTDL